MPVSLVRVPVLVFTCVSVLCMCSVCVSVCTCTSIWPRTSAFDAYSVLVMWDEKFSPKHAYESRRVPIERIVD